MKIINKKLKSYLDLNTPFNVIEFPEHLIRQYLSTKSRKYGYRCITVLDFKSGITTLHVRTNYDSGGKGLAIVLKYINQAPRAMLRGLKTNIDAKIPSCYYIGGNFSRVLKQDIIKIKTGVKS